MSFPFYAIFPTQISKKYSIVLCYLNPSPQITLKSHFLTWFSPFVLPNLTLVGGWVNRFGRDLLPIFFLLFFGGGGFPKGYGWILPAQNLIWSQDCESFSPWLSAHCLGDPKVFRGWSRGWLAEEQPGPLQGTHQTSPLLLIEKPTMGLKYLNTAFDRKSGWKSPNSYFLWNLKRQRGGQAMLAGYQMWTIKGK